MTDTPQPTPEDHRGGRRQDNRPDPAAEAFLTHRNLLFTAAYELLGSAADAEDFLQEAWRRWVDTDVAMTSVPCPGLQATPTGPI